jgi:hypothetical protein
MLDQFIRPPLYQPPPLTHATTSALVSTHDFVARLVSKLGLDGITTPQFAFIGCFWNHAP